VVEEAKGGRERGGEGGMEGWVTKSSSTGLYWREAYLSSFPPSLPPSLPPSPQRTSHRANPTDNRGNEEGRPGGEVKEGEEGEKSSADGSEEVGRSLSVFPTPFLEEGEGEENTEGLKEEGEGGRGGERGRDEQRSRLQRGLGVFPTPLILEEGESEEHA